MTIEVFDGGGRSFIGEEAVLSVIAAFLQSRGEDAVILTNVRIVVPGAVFRRTAEIDLVVATEAATLAIEVKDYRLRVVGGVTGKWVSPDARGGRAERTPGYRRLMVRTPCRTPLPGRSSWPLVALNLSCCLQTGFQKVHSYRLTSITSSFAAPIDFLNSWQVFGRVPTRGRSPGSRSLPWGIGCPPDRLSDRGVSGRGTQQLRYVHYPPKM